MRRSLLACCCAPLVPVAAAVSAAIFVILGQLFAHSMAGGAEDTSNSDQNGGVHRGILGYFALQTALVFGILGYALLLPAFDSKHQAGRSDPTNVCCRRSKSSSFHNVFLWLSGQWSPLVVPPLRLAIEGIGLYWVCMSFLVSSCSIAWLLDFFRPKSVLERAADNFLCHRSPLQAASNIVFPLLHLANSISLRRDLDSGRRPIGALSYCCSVLGIRARPRVRSWWIGRVFSHWASVPLCAILTRTVRLAAELTGMGAAVSSVQLVLRVFFWSLGIVNILSFESSLLARGFSRNALAIVLVCLLVAAAAGLPGLALPDNEAVQSLMFGLVLGYAVPLRLWMIMLSMESQRVGLLLNFLRYLSHEVRVPANVSLLAIDDVKACLKELQAHTDQHPLSTGCPPLETPEFLALSKALPNARESAAQHDHGSSISAEPVPHLQLSTPWKLSLSALQIGAAAPLLSAAGAAPEQAAAAAAKVPLQQLSCPLGQSEAQGLILAAEQSANDVLLSISSMKTLLDRTLDLARFDAGVHSLRMEVFDLRVLLQQLHREVLQVFRPSGVTLIWDSSAVCSAGSGAVPHGAAHPNEPRGSHDDTAQPRQPGSTGSSSVLDEWSPRASQPVGDVRSTFSSAASSSALWVTGDPLQLRQSMMNILHNASKYTPAGQHVYVDIALDVTKRQPVELDEHEEAVAEHEGGLVGLGFQSELRSGSTSPKRPAQASSCPSWLASCCGARPKRSAATGIAQAGAASASWQGHTVTVPMHADADTPRASGAHQEVPPRSFNTRISTGSLSSDMAAGPATGHPLPAMVHGEHGTYLSSASSDGPTGGAAAAELVHPRNSFETRNTGAGTRDLHFKFAGLAMLVMRVRDTGRGMTPAEQRGIFTPFSRLHSAQEGTGLGLNIARKAMQAHGGDVRVHSDGLDKGCTFTVRAQLQLKRAVRTRGPRQAQVAPRAASARRAFFSRQPGVEVVPLGSPQNHSAGLLVAAPEGSSLLGVEAAAFGGATPHSDHSFPDGGMQEASVLLGSGKGDPSAPRSGRDGFGGGGSKGGARAATAPPPGSSAHSGASGRPKPFSGVLVLVVDDDTATRRVMARLLMRLMPGCVVKTAADGAAAVKFVAESVQSPDFITLDNQMPIMTGQEAAKELRARGYQGHIVGVTGNAIGSDGAAFIAAGVDTVVFKPSTAQKLADGLRLQQLT